MQHARAGRRARAGTGAAGSASAGSSRRAPWPRRPGDRGTALSTAKPCWRESSCTPTPRSVDELAVEVQPPAGRPATERMPDLQLVAGDARAAGRGRERDGVQVRAAPGDQSCGVAQPERGLEGRDAARRDRPSCRARAAACRSAALTRTRRARVVALRRTARTLTFASPPAGLGSVGRTTTVRPVDGVDACAGRPRAGSRRSSTSRRSARRRSSRPDGREVGRPPRRMSTRTTSRFVAARA